MKSAEWYRGELIKLQAIMEYREDISNPVSRVYVTEKIRLIIHDLGISAHPCLNARIEEIQTEIKDLVD